jgi:hypothetical protein
MASKCAGVDGVDIKDALALRTEDISDDIIVVSLLLDDFKSDDFNEFTRLLRGFFLWAILANQLY